MQSIRDSFFFPKISLSSLQQKLFFPHYKQSFAHLSKKSSFSPSFKNKVQMQSRSTHQDIHIQSPFYPKTCNKVNCSCLYHRRKRQILSRKINFSKNKQKFKSPMKTLLQQIKKQQADMIRNEKIANTMRIANLQNQRMFKNKHLISSIKTYHKSQDRMKKENDSYSSEEINSFVGKIYNEIVHKGHHHQSRNKNSLESRNQVYQSFLKSRQFRNDEKQLMLKTLIAFLKHKLKQLQREVSPDKIKKRFSNCLLQRRLGVLLNHHTIGQLINREYLQKLSQSDWIRIIKMLNISQQETFQVFDYLREIFEEMRERGNKQHQNQMEGQNKNLESLQKSERDLERLESSQVHTYGIANSSKLGKPKLQKIVSYNKNFSNTTPLSNLSGHKTDTGFPKYEDSLKNTTKSINWNKQNSILTSKQNGILPSKQNKRKDKLRKTQAKITKKNSIESDGQFQLQRGTYQRQQAKDDHRKSIFFLNSSQKQSSKVATDISLLPGKLKKNKKVNLKAEKEPPKPARFDLLQQKIKYQKYCSKQKFKILVDVIDDQQISEQQKMQRAYQALKMQNYFGLNVHNLQIDKSKQKQMQALMDQFQPLINGDLRNKMYRFIAVKRGHKMLDKLYKQIDRGISKLQHFVYPDFGQYQKQQDSFSKMLANSEKSKILNIIQQQDKEDAIAYRSVENIQRVGADSTSFSNTPNINTSSANIYISSVRKKEQRDQIVQQNQLHQQQMGDLILSEINTNVTRRIIHKSKIHKTTLNLHSSISITQSGSQSPKQYDKLMSKLRFTTFDPQQQKQILKYARRYHQKQFKSVLREISIENSPELSRIL